MNGVYLIAYGSFRYGFELHHLVKKHRFVGRGYVEGYELYDLGGYPGAIKGDGVVVGDVYEIDERTLKLMDEIEGVATSDNAFFVRTGVRVYFDERRRFYYDNVQMYVLSPELRGEIERRPKIESGDFSAYVGMPSLVNYFAYAENTNNIVLEERGLTRIPKKIKVRLNGYELVFNVPCSWGACANLKENPNGVVCGYLYQITDQELKYLDKAESNLIRYMKEVVRVVDTEGKEYFAYAYVSPNVDYNLKPSKDYINLIVEGLNEEWKGSCISTGLREVM
jgi:gamma-glutamylcyclotransferase (GGCT)/AIG2-like uncharacterized protein YtfP